MQEWWRERVVYQIYPRSFQDTNGDGVGDIPGIIMHLDELADLGIGVLWLSPLYRSPNVDNGYDISDYRDINPEYGTMADMDELISQAAKRDIKIIMDLVINHTSDEHEWFQKSRDKDDEYKDYYIWSEGKGGGPPNNWTGFFGDGAWEFDEHRGEYYLHLFDKKQPDLNYNNPKVVREVEDIMRFWLDRGVAGFRCDVINVLWKSSLEDGKKRLVLTGLEHYLSQDGCHEIIAQMRKDVLSRYDCFTVGETVFVSPKEGKELCDKARGELDMIFYFEHMDVDCFFMKYFDRPFSPRRFIKTISKWQGALEWNANYFENHDQPRSVSRFGNDKRYWEQSAKLLATMLFSLRGTPFMFQGEEIGMTNADFESMDDIKDAESRGADAILQKAHMPAWLRWKMIKSNTRDNARTPFQWSNDTNAGFTAGTPWLRLNGNYKRINLKQQKKDPFSVRNYYKDMICIRSVSDTLKYGKFKLISARGPLVVYERSHEGRHATVLLNFSRHPRRMRYSGQVVVSSAGREAYDGVLQPYEAVILNGGTKV